VADPNLKIRELYWTSQYVAPRLRIGVLLDSHAAERCFREVLVDIRASNFTELAAVILNDERGATSVPSSRGGDGAVSKWNIRRRSSTLVYRAYLRFVDRRYARVPEPTEIVDCSDLLAGVEELIVRPESVRSTDRFAAADVERIRHLRLDVILRFGFNILRGDVLGVAKYGIWSYHHGDNLKYRGGPALFWEILEGNPESGVVLQVLTEKLDAGLVLCKLITTTSRRPSVAANRFAAYWNAQHLVIRKLKDLYEDGWVGVRNRAVADAPYRGRRSLYLTPDNTTMLRWAAKVAWNSVRGRLIRPNRLPHWRLAIRRSATPLYEDASPAQLSSFRILECADGTFWADPFLFEQAGRLWVFFEEYRYDTGLGHISCAEVLADGGLGPVREALKCPYHLSYPLVFAHDGIVYMLPESHQGGGVDLYRADDFPTKWTRVSRIFDFPAVDVTPLHVDGAWWMFVSPVIVGGHEHVLMLFKGPTLEGPWRQVSSSPLVSHPNGSRGAGIIISAGGRLIRPSQDCSRSYGGALQFNEISRLDETNYREHSIGRIEPTWTPGLTGVHMYNRVGDTEVIDVNCMRPEKDH
jgi:hypothetical protein